MGEHLQFGSEFNELACIWLNLRGSGYDHVWDGQVTGSGPAGSDYDVRPFGSGYNCAPNPHRTAENRGGSLPISLPLLSNKFSHSSLPSPSLNLSLCSPSRSLAREGKMTAAKDEASTIPPNITILHQQPRREDQTRW